jgi:hypothetical protein
MDIAELQQKVERLHSQENDVRDRLALATTDTERLHLERDLRLLQNCQWAFLGSIERQLDRDTARGTAHPSVDHQAAA